jgi:hypothetical protein
MHLTRHHATAFLNPHSSRRVEEPRLTWDPAMAQQIAAHITLIYPEEIADPAELIARATRAAASTPPFSITASSLTFAFVSRWRWRRGWPVSPAETSQKFGRPVPRYVTATK